MSQHAIKQDVAGEVTKVVQEPDYIPMTLPQQKLAVPEIPGFHLHWMLNTNERVHAALRAGYQFVSHEEVQIQNFDLGGDAKVDGNTDMGTRVTRLASSYGDGQIGKDGQPARLILMKQPEELHRKHQKLLEDRNGTIADTLTASFRAGLPGGQAAPGETSEDVAHRYVGKRGQKVPDLFNRNKHRRNSG